ncbi:MAG: Ig-like domain-containing protein, partial [Propionibacteriaceae bacterium]|nr:Ig-like domain-containing protein [Propionibacteriaceae bacterium]
GQDYFDVTKVDGHDVTDAKPDHIANNLPKIEGTGEAAGDKVAITEGGAAICQATVLPDKTWSCVPTAPLADGSHTIRGTETDQAGNVSDPVERTFTIDTVAPPKPDITRPAEGSKTNDATVEVGGVIKGDIDPGTVVIAQDADDPSNQCTAVVQADKTWSCVLPKALPDGVRTVTAHAKDPAGNVSDKDQVHFTVDTTPPWINPDTRDPGDIVVDTEPNSDVVIEDDEGKVICTAHADGAGQAVCHVGDPDDVPRPGDEITITATDEAGNTATKTTRIIQVVVSDKQVVLPLEQSQTATGFFFQPGERVHGVVQPSGQDLGYQTADATGKVVFTWSIADRDQSVGNHTAVLTGSWSGPGEDTFQVSRELPKTGSEVDDAFIAAASLASALGVAFIMMAWRRRREEKKVS